MKNDKSKIKMLSHHVASQATIVNSYMATNARLLKRIDALDERIDHQMKMIECLNLEIAEMNVRRLK